MSEPDRKEKSKKKKSVTKHKEDEALSTSTEDQRKSSLTPERKESEESRKSSTAEGVEQEFKSRKGSIREGSEIRESMPQKLSETEAESQEKARGVYDAEAGNEGKSEKPEESGNHVSAQATNEPVKYFHIPPETIKTDLHLLKNLDTRKLAELMEAFTMFDFDQDGIISEHDLKRTFASLGQPDIESEELRLMLSEALNPLDFDAFVVLMGYKTLELDAEEVLTNALAQWDYGTEGLISEDRIFHDLMSFGDRFTKEEAAAALEDAPVVVTKNKERMIDYMRFSNDLCGLRKRMQDYKPLK